MVFRLAFVLCRRGTLSKEYGWKQELESTLVEPEVVHHDRVDLSSMSLDLNDVDAT